jgi:hypothetical protein
MHQFAHASERGAPWRLNACGSLEFLPARGEVAGVRLRRAEGLSQRHLYQMINGRADIFHEYDRRYARNTGHARQIDQAEITNGQSGCGVFISYINAGEGGKDAGDGQALPRDYTNFWKETS